MHLRLRVLTAVLLEDSNLLGYGVVVSYIFKAHTASITHTVTQQFIPADESSVKPLSVFFFTTLRSVVSSLRIRGHLCYVLDHVQLNQVMACLCRLNTCFGSFCGQKAIARLWCGKRGTFFLFLEDIKRQKQSLWVACHSCQVCKKHCFTGSSRCLRKRQGQDSSKFAKF